MQEHRAIAFYKALSSLRKEVKRRTLATWLDPFVAVGAEIVERLAPRITPVPKSESEVRLRNGQLLTIPPDLPSARRLLSNEYEPEVTGTIQSLLSRGDTVVDIGANIGYYTLTCADLVGETGHVFAFEPNADVIRYLDLNVRQNHLRNVVLVSKAVSECSGDVVFARPDMERGHMVGLRLDALAGSVGAVSLDDYFRDLGWPAVDFIKLDVEGAETLALVGMKELSARNRQLRAVMEVNSSAIRRAGKTAADLRDALWELGFQTVEIIELGRKQVPLSLPLPRSRLVYNIVARKSRSDRS